MMKNAKTLFCTAAMLLMTACQYYDFSEETEDANKTARLHVNLNAFDNLSFDTRASQKLRDVSSRMSYALFYLDGEKVSATQSQTYDSEKYGDIDVRLEPGKYILVIVAHNGEGNCTISSPTEVKFANNIVTDTFVSCDTLQVDEGEQTVNVVLLRRVAMIRLLLEETLPEEVKQLQFYYTGGSSTLDASTGFGCVNSRQKVVLNVPASAYRQEGCTFDVYTFPHEENDVLKLTITAQDATGETLYEQVLPQVPVSPRQITQYRGCLTGNVKAGLQFALEVDGRGWTQADYKL